MPGFLRIEDAEAIGVVHVIVFKLIKLCSAEVVDHKVTARSHEVGSDAVRTMGYLPSKSVGCRFRDQRVLIEQVGKLAVPTNDISA